MTYEDEVVEFFITRRGKASALSSADEQLLMRWAADGVPLGVVFEGIDQAFIRKAEAPKSLSECARWVTLALKRWQVGGGIEVAAHAAPSADSSHAPESRSLDAKAPQAPPDAALPQPGRAVAIALGDIEAVAARGENDALRAAIDEVRAELEAALRPDGSLPTELIEAVAPAIADAFLERATATERAAAEAAGEAALAAARGLPEAARTALWARAVIEAAAVG